MADYIAVIHQEGTSPYGVSFPDFPGCITAGDTLEEARTLAQEVLEFHVEGMLEDGDALPVPSSLDQASRHEFAEDAAAYFVVQLKDDPPVARVNCTFRADVLEEIDAEVERLGTSRSAYLARVALERIRGK